VRRSAGTGAADPFILREADYESLAGAGTRGAPGKEAERYEVSLAGLLGPYKTAHGTVPGHRPAAPHLPAPPPMPFAFRLYDADEPVPLPTWGVFQMWICIAVILCKVWS
jgi:hypothetical protein